MSTATATPPLSGPGHGAGRWLFFTRSRNLHSHRNPPLQQPEPHSAGDVHGYHNTTTLSGHQNPFRISRPKRTDLSPPIWVPARYAAWAELILVQLLVPGVSFLGHLGGILAGLLYVRLQRSSSGSDPLVGIIKGFAGSLNWPCRFLRNMFRLRGRRISGRGTVGGGSRTGLAGAWLCQECTCENSGWLSVCEMCGTGRRSSGWSEHQFSQHSYEPRRQARLKPKANEAIALGPPGKKLFYVWK